MLLMAADNGIYNIGVFSTDSKSKKMLYRVIHTRKKVRSKNAQMKQTQHSGKKLRKCKRLARPGFIEVESQT